MKNSQRNQQWFFSHTGYLILRSVLPPALVVELREWVHSLYEPSNVDRAPSTDLPSKIYGLFDKNPDLISKVLALPELLDALTQLLGPNVVYTKNRHNQASMNTASMTSKEARLHRDILQHSRGVVTAAIYLDDSTLENGATMLIPGSHQLPTVGVTQPDGGGTWDYEFEVYEGLSSQAVAIPMKAGDILLFNGMSFHSVGSNHTDTARTSIIMGFRSMDELEALPDPLRLVNVIGNHIYRGNDR